MPVGMETKAIHGNTMTEFQVFAADAWTKECDAW